MEEKKKNKTKEEEMKVRKVETERTKKLRRQEELSRQKRTE